MSTPFTEESRNMWRILCPKCGGDSIDRISAETGEIASKDQFAVKVNEDRDEYESPINTRGGWVSISLSCGYGHLFDFVIANHKGLELFGFVSKES